MKRLMRCLNWNIYFHCPGRASGQSVDEKLVTLLMGVNFLFKSEINHSVEQNSSSALNIFVH